jgi:CheY-like chemotaxis protein
MKPKGVFIFIDDDEEEHELFKLALREICPNPVLSAYNGEDGFSLIRENKNNIFLIISDMNMARVNGLELKRLIESTPELKMKAIPFVFHSTVTDELVVKEAYSLNIQGYIQKRSDVKTSVEVLRHFIEFWTKTMHPNYFMDKTAL